MGSCPKITLKSAGKGISESMVKENAIHGERNRYNVNLVLN